MRRKSGIPATAYVLTRILQALSAPFLYATLLQDMPMAARIPVGGALLASACLLVSVLVQLALRQPGFRTTQLVAFFGLAIAYSGFAYTAAGSVGPWLSALFLCLLMAEVLWLAYAHRSKRLAARVAA